LYVHAGAVEYKNYVEREYGDMERFERISHDPGVMGGKACIAGTRVTVGVILMHISEGVTHEELIIEYPYLTKRRHYGSNTICRLDCRC